MENGILAHSAALTPRTLWIELTSKCPFDCIFCSRKLRRGAGQHLPFSLYSSLIRSLIDPRVFVLNYSGESTYYPDLIPAIELASETGAWVELVSALSSIPDTLLEALARSPINRLTISVHAVDPQQYSDIYRYSSAAQLRKQLARLMELNQRRERPIVVDIGFVAMERNLDQLPPVAGFVKTLGIHDVLLFPIMRRDEIMLQFSRELAGPAHPTAAFRAMLGATVSVAREQHPEVRFTVCNPLYSATDVCLGEVPVPYPFPLPVGACIHSCEQNPFETAHVLSNGDVVACEVHDHKALGNLHEQTIGEIWSGAAYEAFRKNYLDGSLDACRTCVWKTAHRPAALKSDILAHRGMSAQMTRGWHQPADESHVWSSQQAAAILQPRNGSDTLHVSGHLPPGPPYQPNVLTITCNGHQVGEVNNPWEDVISFGLDFPTHRNGAGPWNVGFRTTHRFRPSDRGTGSDHRDLGFALVLMTAKRRHDPELSGQRARQLKPLRDWIARTDQMGEALRWSFPLAPVSLKKWRPGVTILIPERNHPAELAECLASVKAARIEEPAQVVVVASEAGASRYRHLQQPGVGWRFHRRPLPFLSAIRDGLRAALHDWVYLLNNDVAIDREAIHAALALRAPDVFAIGSEIFLKDSTRFREETNFAWLRVEDGLVSIQDRLPGPEPVAECSYVGGGASLFQRRMLEEFCKASTIYEPFYWEDVEWGWRARKLGFRVLFCQASTVRHRQRTTVSKHYSEEEIENIVQRNRFLFQLRNLTAPDLLDPVFDAIAQAPEQVVQFFLRPSVHYAIARGRMWNHRA